MHSLGNEIVAEAKKLLDIQYGHQGRGARLDCVGVPIYIAHKLGIFTFDTRDYSPRPNANEFTQHMIASGCQQIPRKDLGNGDLVRLAYEGWPVHLAIYEKDERGQEWIIHAFAKHKKVTRDTFLPETKKKISSIWRFPEK